MAQSEAEVLDRIRRHPSTGGLLGDDAAFVDGRGPWAVTVDRQAAGLHFPLELAPEAFAQRLLAVNLSDLAAVGARPAFAFLVLAAPPEFDYDRFFRAFLDGCRRHELVLAGGDLSRAPRPEASLTLLGRPWPRGGFLRRDAGRPGDALWLGGTVGEAAVGLVLQEHGARTRGGRVELASLSPPLPRRLAGPARRAVERHLAPRAQLELGRWLARRRPPGAAIDLSDGLALDLSRLARESGVAAVLDEALLPRAPHHDTLCSRLGLDPLTLVLGGGEDYVLLFTLPQGRRPPAPLACTRVGRLVAGTGIRLRTACGDERELEPVGWDHLRSAT